MIVKKKTKFIDRRELYEMAFKKSQFQHKVIDLATQIAENWCLCRYCHLNCPDWRDYVHWKSELETYLHRLNTVSIVDDSSRERWSKEILIRGDYDNPNVVYKQCYAKFVNEEEIAISKKEQFNLCEEFSNNISEISKCIGSENIIPYVCEWFPEVETKLDRNYKNYI